MQYLDSLNEKQKEAVLYTNGPLLIVAGAGAGKTKTITHRIIHLIHQGVAPENILAVTFTNKAAKEMRERVHSMLDERESSSPFLSTFHSLGVHIIKENAHLIGLNKYFTIIDEHDALVIIKDIMKENNIDPKMHEPRKIKSVISKMKGDFITVTTYTNDVASAFGSIVSLVWRGYEKELKKQKALDFDDLLLESVLILKKYPEIRKKYQDKWRYVHIDEYQDTNEVQYEMVKLLVGVEENICVVGDTDQNIYSWRGANIKNMIHFEKDYPNTKTIMLEQNYRSTANIISAANSVIEKNKYRIPKNLFTENIQGDSIAICECYDEVAEGDFVASTIQELLKEVDPNEIAILYRANFQSRVLEEALLQRQIPYQVLGVKFFERKEIKDIISYIRASLNKESQSDIKRIINTPARGIGKTTLLKIFANLFHELPKAMQEKINRFYMLLDEIKRYIDTNKTSEVVKYVISKSGLEDELKHGSLDDQERLENMKELVTLATRYDNIIDGTEALITDAALSSDQDTLTHKEKINGVRMMTVHASKGLEFKYVFVTGLEQDLFPHARTDNKSKEDNEEERRLFYVAITRARTRLYLSYASLRTIYGMKQVNTPSEFIYDIPESITSFDQHHTSTERVVYL